MNYIREFLKRRSEKKAAALHEEMVADAVSLYQVQEYQGELWLTYSGNLVCPCSMLKSEPVESVAKMRELYIKRKGV